MGRMRQPMGFEMTVAPSHPPVHSYDGEDPYEIIDSKWGKMERWRAISQATGELSALTVLTEKVRNDAADIAVRQDARERALNSREDSISARELKVAIDAAMVSELMGRVGKAIDWIEKQKADAEEPPLPTPPGSDAVSASGDPSDPSKEPEPSLELEGDNIPGTEDPDDPSAKEDQPEFPDPELPHPPVVQQPIAAGLDDKGVKHGN
jgi:hypothetical protein